MVRLSVWLDAEQKQWVEEQAESRDGKQSAVVRELIDRARESDSAVNQPVNHSESVGESVEDRLDELERRVERLEGDAASAGGAPPERRREPSAAEDIEPRDEPHSIDVESLKATGELPPASAAPQAAREALETRGYQKTITKTDARDALLLRLFALLRERGETTTQELKAFHDGHDCGLKRSSWWENLVSPELRRFDGVEPPKRGGNKWRYQ